MFYRNEDEFYSACRNRGLKESRFGYGEVKHLNEQNKPIAKSYTDPEGKFISGRVFEQQPSC